MAPATLTVSQVNFFIKSLLEGDGRLNDICVSGEISNFTRNQRSGHLYFTLKDSGASLKVVMFVSAVRHLKFVPYDGLKVLVRGRISVYEPAGQYQLYAEDILPDGIGALGLSYEQLKERLAQEGLFDAAHKRPVPKYPQRIGVITSSSGAAIRDILQVTGRRWPLATIVFCSVPVQGEEAPEKLTAAVRKLGKKELCDVIILGRGGGSAEDLWAFNDEELVRAVYASEVPVVSAVGHETDFTLCDFVADLRAPTPSAAAEVTTPDGISEKMRIVSMENRIFSAIQIYLDHFRDQLDSLAKESVLAKPQRFLEASQLWLAQMTGSLISEYSQRIQQEKARLRLLSGRMDALSPLKVLQRGYAVVTNGSGELLREAKQVTVGEQVQIKLAQGRIKAQVVERQVRADAGQPEL